MTFIRFILNSKIVNQFFYCKKLSGTTSGQDILNIINKYFKNYDMSWISYVSICIDEASLMTGSIKEFITITKDQNSNISETHCFIHREAIVAKSIVN